MSLGYAKSTCDAMGLPGIAFGQADILKVADLDRAFDVVDATGVLHHMADPWIGWRTLLAVLKPRGLMRVALYSEIGRRHVAAAQRLLAERGFGRDPDDIRRGRQEILALSDDVLAKGAAYMTDFYSLSECRDLLFHVQEHRLRIAADRPLPGGSETRIHRLRARRRGVASVFEAVPRGRCQNRLGKLAPLRGAQSGHTSARCIGILHSYRPSQDGHFLIRIGAHYT